MSRDVGYIADTVRWAGRKAVYSTYQESQGGKESTESGYHAELEIGVKRMREGLVEFVGLRIAVEGIEMVVESSQANNIQCHATEPGQHVDGPIRVFRRAIGQDVAQL